MTDKEKSEIFPYENNALKSFYEQAIPDLKTSSEEIEKGFKNLISGIERGIEFSERKIDMSGKMEGSLNSIFEEIYESIKDGTIEEKLGKNFNKEMFYSAYYKVKGLYKLREEVESLQKRALKNKI